MLRQMRHLLLTLLVAFAVGASGLASASVAVACPMEAPQVTTAHDCCPDDGAGDNKNGGGEQDRSMTDCPFMQLCRTAPAVAPTDAPARPPIQYANLAMPALGPRPLTAAPQDGLFRPPRTT